LQAATLHPSRENRRSLKPILTKPAGVIEDAKFKRREALADLAKAVSKK